jgi:hypothetical protein
MRAQTLGSFARATCEEPSGGRGRDQDMLVGAPGHNPRHTLDPPIRVNRDSARDLFVESCWANREKRH